MKNQFQTVRGFRDIHGSEMSRVALVESKAISVLRGYGYSEIRLPILEKTELFDRGIGETNDTVSKEMYTFDDRDGTSISLRPEGTASCVRALVQSGLARERKPKWWYAGPMFRHERPQKGRYRQFYQVGAEAFGFSGADIDAELIIMTSDLMDELGLTAHATLDLNTLGSSVSRAKYRQELVEYLSPHRDKLDSDSQRRLDVNPLRILDSKVAETQALLKNGPRIHDHLDEESRLRFARLQELLDSANIDFTVKHSLVRGFDYYTHMVFEWNTDELGSQRQIAGGGRYDGLVALLGGPRDIGAVGFSIGVDRMALLHAKAYPETEFADSDIYVIGMNESVRPFASGLARKLRASGRFRVREHQGGGRLGSQMREADRSGAKWALIIGEAEQESQHVGVKWLREDRQQECIPVGSLLEYMSSAMEYST